MKFTPVTEGGVTVRVPVADTITKDLPVFYNPAMTLNRDITLLVLRALDRKGLDIADTLAGSGIRTLRMLKELPSGMIRRIVVNDGNPLFPDVLRANAKLNRLSLGKVEMHCADANVVMNGGGGFDFIDIDPFGSPAPFLDAAVHHLSREGIIALTATDTAALAGTAPDACRRKYWAEPLRNHLMHEVGMRILARKAQLVAAQYERALVPIYCHSTLHYTRLFLKATKGKGAVADVLKRHKYLVYDKETKAFRISDHNKTSSSERAAGPLWTGRLWDVALAKRIAALPQPEGTKKLTRTLYNEASNGAFGFYDIHELAGKWGVDTPPFETLIKALKKGHAASRTHFSPSGIRTTADIAMLRSVLRSI